MSLPPGNSILTPDAGAPAGCKAATADRPASGPHGLRGAAGPEDRRRPPTFSQQVTALLGKQWALQKRAWLMNLFLILLPIFFCIVLMLLQFLVDIELSGRSYKCGCMCTSCCDWTESPDNGYVWECYEATLDRPCSPSSKCSSYNDSVCGAQYSSYQQVAFCDLEDPPVWPALLQMPPEQYRGEAVGGGSAGSSAPATRFNESGSPVYLLYTGNNRTEADQLMSLLMPKDANVIGSRIITAAAAGAQSGATGLSASTLASINLCNTSRQELTSLLAGGSNTSNTSNISAAAASGDAVAQGIAALTGFLANYSITLGSATTTSPTLLIEPGFFSGSPLYGAALASGGGSSGRNTFSSSSASSTDVTQVLPLYYISPNCSALGTTDLYVMNQLSCGFRGALGVPMICTSTMPLWASSAEEVNSYLYCGWKGSGCTAETYDAIGAAGSKTAGGSGGSAVAAVPGSSRGIIQVPSLNIDWGDTAAGTRLDATVWVNNSNLQAQVTPSNQRWPGAINAAVNAFLKQMEGPETEIRLTGVKDFPVKGTKLNLSFSALLGPVFFMWVMQLLLPTYVHGLVTERSGGQLGLMRQQGLGHGPYYAATYIWTMALYVVFMLVFVGFGGGIGLSIFTKTVPGVQAILYLLWGHIMIACSLWISSQWTNANSAVLTSIAAVIFTGLVANLVVVQFVQSGPEWLAIVLELVPSFTLFRGLFEMSQYAFLAEGNGGPGLTFAALHDPKNGMILAWIIMGVETAVVVFGAYYFEQVFGSGSDGRRLHPFFLLGYKLGPGDPRGWAWFMPRRGARLSNCLRPGLSSRAVGGAALPHNDALPRRNLSSSSDVEAGIRAAASHVGGERTTGSNQLRTDLGHPIAQHPTWVEAGHPSSAARPETPPAAHATVQAPVALGIQVERLEPFDPASALSTSIFNEAEDVAVERLRVEVAWACLDERPGGHPAPPSSAATAGVVPACHVEPALPAVSTLLPVDAGYNVASSKGPAAEWSVAMGVIAGEVKAGSRVGGSGDAPPPALLLRGLRKVYPSKDGRLPVKVAVSDLSLMVSRHESFGLLGPNGAGKTTVLRMMQGMLEPSAGSISVCGKDIAAHPWECALQVGICPQHDTLWPSMTAREHLLCYGRLKGLSVRKTRHGRAQPPTQTDLSVVTHLPGAPGPRFGLPDLDLDLDADMDLAVSVEQCLMDVGLQGAVADQPCHTYSGGMKRRLSVAMSLVGRPQVVYLDEPSTGLDPASRRQLWKAIQCARQRCAVVLTTHYMEEAERLCDRLGIFVAGALQCIGSPKELTSRYSQSLLLHLTTPEEQEERARLMVARRICPGAKQVYSLGGTQTFELPKSQVELRDVFRAVLEAKGCGELQVHDWGVSNATLDQVFLRIVGAASAADERQDAAA